jgi:predicted lipoprotein with Yx(FWY)xxD motif
MSTFEGSEMPRPIRFVRVLARPRSVALLLAGVLGFGTAALGGLALAKTFTLQVAKKAKVVNFLTHAVTHKNIVVSSRGAALYTLSGETTHHLKCTSSTCLGFWPPLKAKSAKGLSKASGIKGKLGVVHRKGFTQVTLAGHPLYMFSQDMQKRVATGEGISSFGGTWHVVAASSHNRSSGSPTIGSTSTMPYGSTSTVPY